MLSAEQKELYIRNIILPEIGESGQQKLLDAKVLVIGAGGLGSSVIQYLACAGIGKIGIIDNDKVELSNLQRQIIHNFSNLGQLKTDSAKEKLQKLAPHSQIETFSLRIDKKNITKIITNYDIVIDATDNFSTRFIINEACHQNRKPLIFGAVKGFQGQLSVFKSYENNQACYACFNNSQNKEILEPPLQEKGILGAVAGAVGAMQANYAIKEILDLNKNIYNKILIFDFLENNFRKTTLLKNPNCNICQ